MTTCTRCQTTGFLNMHQVDDEIIKQFDASSDEKIICKWVDENQPNDVCDCDCCDGSGEHDRTIEKFFNCM
jgi:hypothetical protein